jgi:acyl-CoA synthetase (AMP-forming)/AMP-acid ligase II
MANPMTMYLTQPLHRALQQHPERIAVRFANRMRSFREFTQRVARLASALQSLGMGPGDPVAILSLNSDRYLEYQLAVPWGGGVMNPCNTRWSVPEIVYALVDSGSVLLLVDDALLPLVERIRHDVTSLKNVIYCGEAAAPRGILDYEALIARAEPVSDAWRRGEDLAGIFYTGGTTGRPKGVMLSHTNLCISAQALLAEGVARRGESYLHAAPMFHLADIGIALTNWIAGNTHVIIPAFNPPAVVEAIERKRVSTVLLVPTMIQLLVDYLDNEPPRDLKSLETVVYGASPISETLLERSMIALPQVDFIQAYGMTELAPLATINLPHHGRREHGSIGKSRSAGRACCCTEVLVVNERGNEVPRGTVGEVVVRGPNVMRGYWNKPAETAAALRDGWMHTGDGAYMDDDGFIFVVDRLKDMIITGGENVYSVEVENALAQHSAVAACAVIGIPNAKWGEAVHAVIVPKPGQVVTADALIEHCRALIAGYKCPRSVAFQDSLPLSGTGKVLKSQLRESYWRDRARQI